MCKYSVFSIQFSDLFIDDNGFAVNFLVAEPETIDLGAVSCGNEGLDMIVTDKRHHGRELVLGQERLDLNMLLHAVSACNII